jgi:hypothetical protein
MTEDPKKRLEDDEEKGDPAKPSPEEKGDQDDESASVLFFGDKLENLVDGEKVSGAAISSEPEEAEKTPMDSPSALFFGESLEDAAEREAREEAEVAADESGDDEANGSEGDESR